jgi:hypothetical protein
MFISRSFHPDDNAMQPGLKLQAVCSLQKGKSRASHVIVPVSRSRSGSDGIKAGALASFFEALSSREAVCASLENALREMLHGAAPGSKPV